MIVSVYTQSAYTNQKAYLYTCDFPVSKGMRVLVPYQQKTIMAMVVDINPPLDKALDLKAVIQVIDDHPILTYDQFALIDYALSVSVSEPMQWILAILPSFLKPKNAAKSIPSIKYIIPSNQLVNLTTKQQQHLSFITNHQPITLTQAKSASVALTNALLKKGACTILEKQKPIAFIKAKKQVPFKQLTNDQQAVFDQINIHAYQPYLLFGATGSGKTEIYMQLVDKVLKQNKSALVLVPEVALTPQMLDRFGSHFNQDIIVYHSHMTDIQKVAAYNQVLTQPQSLIIGTRSAIFLPFQHLGCIIIDEQHDTSFKQENTPTYHAIDLALFLAKRANIPCVMGSATPSLESYARGLKGVYALLNLPKRINHNFAKVSVVDMHQVYQSQPNTILSDQLHQAIIKTLKQNQQVIILLNRRGTHPYVHCTHCNQAAMCDHCDVMLTYHHQDKRLHCHQCGASYSEYTCKVCQHKQFKGSGMATAKLQVYLQSIFKSANIARLDADSVKTKGAHQKILQDFNDHHIDILIGTQMVAKGLDVPNVTLVGILQADAALNHVDYRSVETVFSLITQAAGRSGRHQNQGEVIIQAFNPSHYGIMCAAKQDYIGFFKQEMIYRKLGFLPPYSYMIALTIVSDSQQEAMIAASKLASVCKEKNLNTLGPASLGKRSQKYRVRIILRSTNQVEMLSQIKQILADHPFKKASVFVNVNPTHLE